MNKLGCLIGMFVTCGVCEAQNLVPNSDFELYDTCPDYGGQIERCIGWKIFSGPATTPDYYNTCDTSGLFAPPNALFAHQWPHSGVAYSAIYTFWPNEYREYMGIQLSQSMVISQKYFVSFYVSMGEQYANTAPSNKIGARFSTVQFDTFHPCPTNNWAHVYTDSIISDSVNWTLLSWAFIADSSYQYFIIGNFFDNNNTDTIKYASNCYGSYYVIDDVCVSTDSLTCNSTVGVNEVRNTDKLVLFPNPFSDKINITTKAAELVEVNLFDVTSRKIFHQSFTKSISINTEQLAKGIYLYEVRNKNGVIKKGKVVKD